MKFRKKPVVIEAMQLTRNTADVCVRFIGEDKIGNYNLGEFIEDSCYIVIYTLEGAMTASEGDWIIKGVKGEFYPCKPDIFEQTYEEQNNIGVWRLQKTNSQIECRQSLLPMPTIRRRDEKH